MRNKVNYKVGLNKGVVMGDTKYILMLTVQCIIIILVTIYGVDTRDLFNSTQKQINKNHTEILQLIAESNGAKLDLLRGIKRARGNR